MAIIYHLLILLSIATCTLTVSGITLDLIPIDSSQSTSHVDKLYATVDYSNARAREIIARATGATLTSLTLPVNYSIGGYYVTLYIGTPPNRVNLMLDTGSDLTWTQCNPCLCFDQGIPKFDPSKSATYGVVLCDTDTCNSLPKRFRICYLETACWFILSYVDNSIVTGGLVRDTLTFGDSISVQVQNFYFGCAHQTTGAFLSGTTGILGLGPGALSLPTETKSAPEFGGKFAYCLVPPNKGFKGVASKLKFGNDLAFTGIDIPLVINPTEKAYSANLTRISVGGGDYIRNIPSGEVDFPGDLVIDSGSTLTYLPETMLDQLILDLKLKVLAYPITDPDGKFYLCFQGEIEAPPIVLHFDGSDSGWELPMSNTFSTVAKDVTCLTMLPSPDPNYGLLGSVAQQNFLVGFDLNAMKVTVKATDCTTYEA